MERINKLNLQDGARSCLRSRACAPRAGQVARFARADSSDAWQRGGSGVKMPRWLQARCIVLEAILYIRRHDRMAWHQGL